MHISTIKDKLLINNYIEVFERNKCNYSDNTIKFVDSVIDFYLKKDFLTQKQWWYFRKAILKRKPTKQDCKKDSFSEKRKFVPKTILRKKKNEQ